MNRFLASTTLPASPARVFAYHATPRAFARLSPPWDEARIVEPLRALRDGERASFDVALGPARVRWVALHERVHDASTGGDAGFVDVMQQGPFRAWRHEHRFRSVAGQQDTCVLDDEIEFALPRLPLAGVIGGAIAQQRLSRMFRFRHDTTRLDLALLSSLPALPAGAVVGVTGASGLIGREVCALLSVAGARVMRFVRVASADVRVSDDDAWAWVPSTGFVDPRASGVHAVVHLAGENIGDGRLDAARRMRIHHERVANARALLASLRALPTPPRVVVSASAVGFFGSRGDERLDENSAPGGSAFATLCRDWEDASLHDAATAPWRSVVLRIGIVLSPAGGALQRMLPAFRAGVGGVLGSGTQWMPTIAIDDVGAIALRAIVDERMHGIVHATGPEPVTNAQLTRTLASVLHRPALLPVPETALRVAFGELADEALLASARAEPTTLRALGHTFRHATTEAALRHVLGVYEDGT